MNKRKFIAAMCLGLTAMATAGVSYANDQDTAITLVESAAKAVAANRDAGMKDIQADKFSKGEIYVFAYDLNAVMQAHPKNPKLVGKNLMDQPDAEGKLFRKEIVEKAKATGSGWVDYVYKNPETKAMEQKTTYLKRQGDLVLCAGIYK